MLYAAAATVTLAPYLDLTIDMGRADVGAFGSCGGFVARRASTPATLADFGAAHPNYATGAPTWDPADDHETPSFRFTVAVQDDPAAAGKSATSGSPGEPRRHERRRRVEGAASGRAAAVIVAAAPSPWR